MYQTTLRLLAGLLCCVACVAAVLCSTATDVAAQEPIRVVVLDVKPGGTQLLVDSIQTASNIEIKRQEWFVDQIRERDIKGNKIMTRPEDLRYLMSAADIAYIIAVVKSGGDWKGSIYDRSGELSIEFESPKTSDDLDQAAADLARRELRTLLGLSNETEAVEFAEDEVEPTRTTGTETDEVAGSEPEESAKSAAPGAAPALSIGLSPRLWKREFAVAGDNGATVTVQSAFYPGASIDAELFPRSLALGLGDLGFGLAIDAGFDSLVGADETVSVLQLEAQGDIELRIDRTSGLRLTLGARHSRFMLPANDLFPTLTHTSAILGARITQPLGKIAIDAGVGAIPFGIYNNGYTLFGASARSYGFTGRFAVLYGLGTSLRLIVGARARLLRTLHPGEGSLDFRDSTSFELVWGPEVGITWRN